MVVKRKLVLCSDALVHVSLLAVTNADDLMGWPQIWAN